MIDASSENLSRQSPERPKQITRPVSVVELKVKGKEGVYIPLLKPTNPNRQDEWELPGGSRETDIEGEQTMKKRWNEHENLLPSIYDDPGDYVSTETIRDSFDRNVRSSDAREEEWLKEQMKRELKEEIGLIIKDGQIVQLPLDSGGNYVSNRNYVKGGKGEQVEIISVPFLVQSNELDELPELTLSPEHGQVIYLYFEGWSGNHRKKWITIQKQLIPNPSSQKDATGVSLEPTGEENVYAFSEPDSTDSSRFRLSQVSTYVLERYFTASFLDKLPSPLS